ncbi:MAG: DUF2062 domain-containing protein, partial [Gammaproteobacteria bacterium]|nr:DUF2062 domain-containing protein [Gammaproteobacteria bacterium]
MPKQIFKRLMPDPNKVRKHKNLQCLGTLLHDPNLWHINRRSIANAFGVGLFMAWMPVPFQMLFAAIAAVPCRANLPISISLVWLTNPITMPALFYFAYVVGAALLGYDAQIFQFELSLAWFSNGLEQIWQPFLLGCLVMGIVSALLGYAGMRIFWRYHVVQALKKRQRRKAQH